MKTILISLAFITIISFNQRSFSQNENNSHVYTVTTLKVPFDALDDFMKNWEKYITPIIKQDSFIISEKVLTHLWGPDWTVLVIDEYKSWNDIEESGKKYDEITAAMEPDKDKRNEIGKMFIPYYNGHTDAIVLDNPRLSK